MLLLAKLIHLTGHFTGGAVTPTVPKKQTRTPATRKRERQPCLWSKPGCTAPDPHRGGTVSRTRIFSRPPPRLKQRVLVIRPADTDGSTFLRPGSAFRMRNADTHTLFCPSVEILLGIPHQDPSSRSLIRYDRSQQESVTPMFMEAKCCNKMFESLDKDFPDNIRPSKIMFNF